MNFLLQRKTCFKLASGVCTCRFGLMALHVPPRWRQDQNMYYAIQGPQSVVRVDWMDYWFWWWLFYCSSLDVFKDSSEYNMIWNLLKKDVTLRDSEEEDTNIARGGYRGYRGGYKDPESGSATGEEFAKFGLAATFAFRTEFLHFANTAVIVFEIEM